MSLNLTRTKTASQASISSRFGYKPNTIPWSRPSDWLPLPTLQATDNKFVGLVAVTNDDSNVIALTCTTSTGTYTVDWGDGSAPQTYASGSTANYQYTYSTISSSTLSVLGYKQAVVTVTPTTGGETLTTFSLQVTPTGYATTASVNWLDIAIAGQSLTSVSVAQIDGTYGTRNIILAMLQQVTIVSLASTYASLAYFCYFLTSLESFICKDNLSSCVEFINMFSDCRSLTSVPLFNTSSGTDFVGMFQNCFSLTSVPLFNTSSGTDFLGMFLSCNSLTSVPLFNTSSGTDFSSMFSNCYSLTSIPLFNTSLGTNFSGMFNGCRSLTSVPLFNTSSGTNFSSMFATCNSLTSVPLFNTSSGTNFSSMFATCYSLTSVPLFNTSLGTNFSSMFANCNSLTSVPLFNTSSGTNFSSMFNSCFSLTSVPLFNTSSGTNFSSMFANCNSLTSVPLFNTSSGTNFSSMFLTCRSLASAALSGTRFVISYTSASRLARTQLVDIFNGLGTASGAQTINITNCYGSSSLTAGERSIATGKGWIISG